MIKLSKQDTENLSRIQVLKAYCGLYKHFLWAIPIFIFITAFMLKEKYVLYESYWVSYIPLDDKIPFVPAFVVFYYAWFAVLGLTGFYHLFTDAKVFKRYMWALIIGFASIYVYNWVFPNGQNLRPSNVPFGFVDSYSLNADTFFGGLLSGIYSVDNNQNVLPSMHVYAGIIAVVSLFDTKRTRKWYVIAPVTVIVLFIFASTVFIKQHSALDIFTAFIPAAIVVPIVYVWIRRKQLSA